MSDKDFLNQVNMNEIINQFKERIDILKESWDHFTCENKQAIEQGNLDAFENMVSTIQSQNANILIDLNLMKKYFNIDDGYVNNLFGQAELNQEEINDISIDIETPPEQLDSLQSWESEDSTDIDQDIVQTRPTKNFHGVRHTENNRRSKKYAFQKNIACDQRDKIVIDLVEYPSTIKDLVVDFETVVFPQLKYLQRSMGKKALRNIAKLA